MIATDLVRVHDFIEGHWGSLPKAWTNSRVMVDEFGGFTCGAVLEALHEMFREGTDFAPKPPSVYRRTAIVQKRRYERGEDEPPSRECRGDHVWGVVHYPGAVFVQNDEPEPVDDCDELTEHHQCVLCREERYLRRAVA